MVCLVIISLLGAVIGVKGTQLLSHHRFRRGASSFLQDVHRWQVFAMTQSCDVLCSIERDPSSSTYRITIDPKMSKTPSFHVISGAGPLFFQGKPVNRLDIVFYSSGRISPQGVVRMTSKSEEQKLSVDLSYPLHFQEEDIPPIRLSPPPYPYIFKEK